MKLDILQVTEIIALGCSVITVHPKNIRPIRPLLYVMIIVVTAEALGYYFRKVIHHPNHNIYNVSVPLIIMMLLYLFSTQLTTNAHRISIQLLMILYCSYVIINLAFVQGTGAFSTYNYITGALFLSTATILFLIELIKVPKQLQLLSEPLFWLSAGILLMYIPKSILYSVYEYLLYKKDITASFAETFSFINTVLSVIFYALISIACTCRLIIQR